MGCRFASIGVKTIVGFLDKSQGALIINGDFGMFFITGDPYDLSLKVKFVQEMSIAAKSHLNLTKNWTENSIESDKSNFI